MIPLGLKTRTIDKVFITDACTNCGQRNTLTLSILMQYGHVFVIPVIPVDIKGVTICSCCNDTLKNEQFYDSVQVQFQAIKKTYKNPPLWTFTGIILLGLVVVISFIQLIFGMSE